MGLQPLPVPVGILDEEVAHDSLRKPARAGFQPRNVAGERAMAHGRAPVEDVNPFQPCCAAQLKRIAEVRKAGFLRKLLRLAGRNVRAPGLDRIAKRGHLGTVDEVHVEAGADDHGVKLMNLLAGFDPGSRKNVLPAFSESD